MPQYLVPNTSNQGQIQYATIGRPVYSFGFNNNQNNPQGPPAPGTPSLSLSANANANIAGTLFVKTTYSFPTQATVVSPNSTLQGFVSNTSNIAATIGNAVVVTSPNASADLNSAAIGYNVFAGYTANTANLVNNYVIPIGTNFNITSNVQLQQIGGAQTGTTSKTNTLTTESITAGEAGLQYTIPVAGTDFVGGKTVTLYTRYVTAPTSINIALQAAFVDGPNTYSNIAFSTNTAGDFITLPNINASFIRAYVVSGNSNAAVVGLRID